MQNLNRTFASVNGKVANMLDMLARFNVAIDPAVDIDNFYNFVWNVDTAKGHGLDVWGRIVGVSRVVQIPFVGYIGFAEGGYVGFGQGVLFSDALTGASNNYSLSDDAYRVLILVKAFSNIVRSTSQNYNRMLMQLFPNRGNASVIDYGSMIIILNFGFYLLDWELAILKQSNAFQAPTGVKMLIQQVVPTQTIGFAEGGYVGFGQGVLFRGFS